MSPGRVWLSTVAAGFDPVRDVALGPWCFQGAEAVYPEWDTLPFLDAFATPAEISEAYTAALDLSNLLVARLAETLNRRHGCHRSFAFWHTLLFPWAQLLVHNAWTRWVQVAKVAVQAGPKPLRVEIVRAEDAWAFSDIEDFFDRGIRNPAFDHWLCSLAVEQMNPSGWILEPRALTTAEYRPVAPKAVPPFRTSPLRALVRRWFKRLRVSSIAGLSRAALPLSLYVALLPARRSQRIHWVIPPQAPPPLFPPAFLAMLDHLVEVCLPASYGGDGFATLDTEAAALAYVPGKLFITAPTIYNDRAKFVLAHAQEAGERIVRSQHGGTYGTAQYLATAGTEYVQAGLLTWGWKHQGDYQGNFVPLPSPHLSPIRGAYRRTSDDLILVGTRIWLRPVKIDSLAKPTDALTARRFKAAFIAALPDRVRSHLRYRPYTRDTPEIRDTDWLEERVGPLPVLTGDFKTAMLGCRLLALDHPGSTLPQSLAAGVPTVCFWDPQAWGMCPQAQADIDALAAVGIVHTTPEAAAAHIAKIWDDVDSWWNQPATVRAREQYLSRHGRTSRFWWWHWLIGLARL